MLAHVRDALTVCSRIEELNLGRRFPCVLLMSNLVNTDEAERSAFLATCARHVAPDGLVLIERHAPHWRPEEGVASLLGEITVSLENVRADTDRVSATVRYDAEGKTWRHPFTAHILDDAELSASLAAAGLELAAALDDAGRWVAAAPILAGIVAA